MTVVYQGKYSHCMRIGIAVPLNSTVYRLRDAVSRETKIPMDQVLFLSHYQRGGLTRGLVVTVPAGSLGRWALFFFKLLSCRSQTEGGGSEHSWTFRHVLTRLPWGGGSNT